MDETLSFNFLTQSVENDAPSEENEAGNLTSEIPSLIHKVRSLTDETLSFNLLTQSVENDAPSEDNEAETLIIESRPSP